MPTATVENYLKAIYHLQQQASGPVRTKDIADRLEVTASSVTNMFKSLAQDGMLTYVRYQGAQLTSVGERAALRIIRNHRLMELFLIQTLGFSWDEVHHEAEALEHAISDELANRIDAFLDFPDADPHGDPIPRADGTMAKLDTLGLHELDHNVPARVRRVLDQSPEILRYLAEIGVTPGATITVVREEPFEGPFTVDLTGRALVALSRTLAHRIVVDRPLEQSPSAEDSDATPRVLLVD